MPLLQLAAQVFHRDDPPRREVFPRLTQRLSILVSQWLVIERGTIETTCERVAIIFAGHLDY